MKLYEKYFIKKNDDRKELFRIIKSEFNPSTGLYPGSFVHITPSFFIPKMTYVDTDKRCHNFFSDDELIQFINKKKEYKSKTVIKYLNNDFTHNISTQTDSFELLISLYAGFISKHCKKFLKLNGILVTNNSHGDASIAFTDKDFKLIGVFKRRGEKFKLIANDLEKYFIKKDGSEIDCEKVLRKMIGEGFTNTGYAYVFKRIK
ncbi:MAG: hypothetical protein P9L97_06655 [Candidatus Tenebribacter davisii]|nr:hypothetical protein [Candidatus Tenebribacter davisii]